MSAVRPGASTGSIGQWSIAISEGPGHHRRGRLKPGRTGDTQDTGAGYDVGSDFDGVGGRWLQVHVFIFSGGRVGEGSIGEQRCSNKKVCLQAVPNEQRIFQHPTVGPCISSWLHAPAPGRQG